MECPTCRSNLEPHASFCGVCGYRVPAGGLGGLDGGRVFSDFGGYLIPENHTVSLCVGFGDHCK